MSRAATPWFLIAPSEPQPWLRGATGGAARTLFSAAAPTATPTAPPAATKAAPPKPAPIPPTAPVAASPASSASSASPASPASLAAAAAAGAPVAAAPATVPAAFEQAAAALDALHEELISSARSETIELALALARRVIGEVVRRGDVDVQPMIDEALQRLGDGLKVTVRVHPRQRAALDGWIAQKDPSAVVVVYDDALDVSDVVVESDSGVVDARVASRFARVEAAARASLQAKP